MKTLFRGSRGSTMVEAAMVFPLVMIITAAVIMTGLKMYAAVRTDAEMRKSGSRTEKTVTAEDILRGKWTISQGKRNESGERIIMEEAE